MKLPNTSDSSRVRMGMVPSVGSMCSVSRVRPAQPYCCRTPLQRAPASASCSRHRRHRLSGHHTLLTLLGPMMIPSISLRTRRSQVHGMMTPTDGSELRARHEETGQPKRLCIELRCVVFLLYVCICICILPTGGIWKCILFVYRIFILVLYISIHFNQASWWW